MELPNFIRAARQLNLTRQFLSSHAMKIISPSGVNYEAFDNTGTKLTPFSLLQLFEAARSFTLWAMPHLGQPDSSLVEYHRLSEKYFSFTAAYTLDVNKELYKMSSPKYPLEFEQTVDYVGRSSIRFCSVLKHPDLKVSYADCKVQLVLTDVNTRRSTPFPDWWKEKYASNDMKGVPLFMKPLPKPEVDTNVHHFPVTVYPSDADGYGHTNWSNYAKYCNDAHVFGAMDNYFQNISIRSIENGLRSLELSFKRESGPGDILGIASWENTDVGGSVGLNVQIKRGTEVCAEAVMSYFDDV